MIQEIDIAVISVHGFANYTVYGINFNILMYSIFEMVYLYGNFLMDKLPIISKRTFWDVEVGHQDFTDAAEWVIIRVFDRGTLDEVYEIINYYGSNFVKQVLQNTNENLPNHAILLARAIFKLKYKDFKCSEKRPFQLHY